MSFWRWSPPSRPRSEHPIADAIVAAAQEKGLKLAEVSAFEAVPGFGLKASVGGREVAIGADRYMAKLGADVAVFAEDAKRFGDEGQSPLYAAWMAGSRRSSPLPIR